MRYVTCFHDSPEAPPMAALTADCEFIARADDIEDGFFAVGHAGSATLYCATDNGRPHRVASTHYKRGKRKDFFAAVDHMWDAAFGEA